MKDTEKQFTITTFYWYVLMMFHVLSIISTILLCIYTHIAWQTWALFVILYFLGILSFTMGSHRLWSHKSFHAHPIVQIFLMLFSCSVVLKSVINFAALHRRHHLYTDTAQDPHSPLVSFWHSHCGWFKYDNECFDVYDNVDDLKRNPLLVFQHQYYVLLATFMAFALPALLASLWGQALQGLILAGLFRVVLSHHSIWTVSSFCHITGTQHYQNNDSARDQVWLSLVTLGDSYHNYHHAFPYDYRAGVRHRDFDVTKWIIFLLSLVKLTSNLKRAEERKKG